MIEIPSSDTAPQEIAVAARTPDVLPILPLKDSVPFPETLTPLAVGQERSIKLVNDVLSGNRMLAMVASRDGEIENVAALNERLELLEHRNASSDFAIRQRRYPCIKAAAKVGGPE